MVRATPLWILMRRRSYVRILSEAIKAVIPEVEVYVVGGAANDRLTVKSDIDILVVLPHKLGFTETVDLHAKILKEAEKLKLPLYAPIELHIVSKEELKKYKQREKIIPINEI